MDDEIAVTRIGFKYKILMKSREGNSYANGDQ